MSHIHIHTVETQNKFIRLIRPDYKFDEEILDDDESDSEEKKPVKIRRQPGTVEYVITAADGALLKHYRQHISLHKKKDRPPAQGEIPPIKKYNSGLEFKNRAKTKKTQTKSGKKTQTCKSTIIKDEESNSDECEAPKSQQFSQILQNSTYKNLPIVNNNNNNNNNQEYLSYEEILFIDRMNVSDKSKNSIIQFDDINKIYASLNAAVGKIHKVVVSHYNKAVTNLISEHISSLIEALNFISSIDVLFSHAYTAEKYNYHRPTFINDENEHSAFIAKNLRHPIAETLVQSYSEFVPNDIAFGGDIGDDHNNPEPININGIMLFGVNNSGKSVMLKSVALAVIMAQSGCYVAASSLEIRIFHNIITRLSGTDNMKNGQGTFAVEMSELRTILATATPKTLVLGDEICHGTEYPSAISIVAASILGFFFFNFNTKIKFCFRNGQFEYKFYFCYTSAFLVKYKGNYKFINSEI